MNQIKLYKFTSCFIYLTAVSCVFPRFSSPVSHSPAVSTSPSNPLCLCVCMSVYLLSSLYKLFDATEIGLIGI